MSRICDIWFTDTVVLVICDTYLLNTENAPNTCNYWYFIIKCQKTSVTKDHFSSSVMILCTMMLRTMWGIVPWMRNNAGYNTLNDEWWMMNDEWWWLRGMSYQCLRFNVFINVLMFLYESTPYAKWRCYYKMFKGIWERFSNIVHGFVYWVDGSPLVSNILQID